MIDKVTILGEAADAQFKYWQKINQEAFYLNIKGRKAMMHKVVCNHLGKAEEMNSAKNAKVCSNDSDELKNWAKANDFELQICLDCNK